MSPKRVASVVPGILAGAMACSNGVGPLVEDPSVRIVVFDSSTSSQTDSVKTLESLKRDGDLFVLTYHGDYDERLEALNDSIVEHGIAAVIPGGASPPECSIFSAFGNLGLPILGRNLDNNAPRAVLVARYTPSNGYASLGVSNMCHLGFGRDDDPIALPTAARFRLLNSVLFVDDGVNARGVSVALASVDPEPIARNASRKLAAISYVIRKILDHAGDLDEAIEIVRNHDVFDQDVNTISHHLLIADAAGSSAVMEYVDGRWRVLPNDRPWQIATNTLLYGRTRDWVRGHCRRYRVADDYLEGVGGAATWQQGMNVLTRMSVSETQWSSVYDLANRLGYLCLHRACETAYRVGF